MAKAKNVLFIMFDQLRRDYLSCYGHPHLKTPHMDALAARGVRFDRAYIQSPICGSSRMSTYTGRYVQSHGATGNMIPLRVGEMTMGDHLRAAGMGCWLIGKTHMKADAEGMARLGLEPDSMIGARVAECGFDIFERNDGLMPEGPDGAYDPDGVTDYNAYLSAKGYGGHNPWHDHANSGRAQDGGVLSGWFLNNSAEPANIADEDSETPYLTTRAMEFIEQAKGPWCAHLSYIKPHWPYIVPAPYHDMYGPEHITPPVRSQAEYDTAHPVLRSFMDTPVGRSFSKDEIRDKVIPAYMGLIKQADDQMGRLFSWLEETGRMQDTTIVLTSDHGDFLGDHWLGEKMFFHDASTRIPLIIYDPSPQADATRGMVSDALVESIDLAPTFVELAGGEVASHVLEGRSLLPILHGETTQTGREYAICEYNFAASPVAAEIGLNERTAGMFMVATKSWKLVWFEGGFRPILFDLVSDPDELTDLGGDPACADVIDRMLGHLFEWARRVSQRTSISDGDLAQMRKWSRRVGVLIGVADSADVAPDVAAKYQGYKTAAIPDPSDR